MLLVSCTHERLHAQDESLSLSLYGGLAAGYAPWKSYNTFRKQYNTVNESSLKSKLGSLSEQYGYKLGMDFFVANHYYSSVEWNHLSAKAGAEFTNGSKRFFKSQTNAINCYVGWKQFTGKGAWVLATGFGVVFGRINGWVRFADKTDYYNTQGFSGEFSDVAIGIPVKFDYEHKISEKFGWKFGVQYVYYSAPSKDGMHNVFGTNTAYAVGLGDKIVKLDVSSFTLQAGITFNLFSE